MKCFFYKFLIKPAVLEILNNMQNNCLEFLQPIFQTRTSLVQKWVTVLVYTCSRRMYRPYKMKLVLLPSRLKDCTVGKSLYLQLEDVQPNRMKQVPLSTRLKDCTVGKSLHLQLEDVQAIQDETGFTPQQIERLYSR